MKQRALVLALAVLAPAAAQAATYSIDPDHTFPNFRISHLGFSTLHGRFGKTTGTLELDPEARTASVSITIDASSVDTGQRSRDDHLRSPDFLNVAEFPQITFQSTAVQWNGATPVTVSGDLTIAGVSRPVTLSIDAMRCGEHPLSKKPLCGFDASATIKRSDFGVQYGVPAIGDEMQLSFEVEAYRN